MTLEHSAGGGRRGIFMGVALLLVVAAVVSATVVAIGQERQSAQPIAELVPADTHVYLSLNTDLTSRGWASLPELLRALNVEGDVRDGLQDSFAEEGIDYRAEVEPLLGTLRGAAVAVYVHSNRLSDALSGGPEDEVAEMVVIVDSREPEQVLALFDRLATSADEDHARTTRRDEERGLDVIEYEASAGREADSSPLVIARTGDVLYVAERYEHIASLVDRRVESGSLAALNEFQSLRGELSDNVLLFGYLNGAFLEDLPFAEMMRAYGGEVSDFDPAGLTAGFAVTASRDGFGTSLTVMGRDGLGDLAAAAMEPASIDRAAAIAPSDTLFFFAATGLREGLEAMFESVDQGDAFTSDMVDEFIAPIELQSGVDLRRDIVANLTGTYAVALGGRDLEMLDLFALVLLESRNRPALRDALQQLLDAFEELCMCGLGVTVDDRDGFVQVRWPAGGPGGGPRLDVTSGFRQTRSLLEQDSLGILYFNPAALPESLLDEISRGSGGEDINLGAIVGVGISWDGDEDIARMSFVIAVQGD
jgi:hypothetical protein